ncbi:ThiJ/PfpI protein [candidate division SR1 bacterium RAAC1_SR1_1]|nr:ThiJ/PfpI protein [candidate division SR1 bacterium RAAC1_SR1_1]
MKNILFVIANKKFQDFEYRIPREILENEGHQITICAEHTGLCVGVFDHETTATIALKEAKGADYDAIIFVGGGGALRQYQNHPEYLRLATEAKLLCAICIAPSIVSDSGVFKGKQVTGRDDEEGTWQQYIENNGGIFIKKNVVVDENIITANGPQSATAFGNEIANALRK